MANRRPSFLRRNVDKIEPTQRILIVCEGEKTEVNYFKGFRLTNVTLCFHGAGANTVSVVEAARELNEREKRRYEQVWCVFDRDSHPLDRFNEAFQLAESYGFKIAYSNESFELWYCLHFHYYSSALGRQDYVSQLIGLLGEKYDKASRLMYRLLKDRQPVAIQNAKKLLAWHGVVSPASSNPSTTVHLLVERLNEYLEK